VTAINVLLVEDNLGDVLLVREAMDAHEIHYQLMVISDGEEAVGYMARMGKSAEEPCPDVLLLDLNNPEDGAPCLRLDFETGENDSDGQDAIPTIKTSRFSENSLVQPFQCPITFKS